MTMNYFSWLPAVLFSLIFFAVIVYRYARKRNKWVQKYWMLTESRTSEWSRNLTVLSFVILGISLLDIRGPEEKVLLDVPEKRTLIVIDTSASMLVEDVSPNRFSRALLLARHFIRTSSSDLKSIIVFSDQAKRIIPFTFDRDLLDSRLMAIEAMDIHSGGSNISLALEQAIQYLRSEQSSENITVGNILLITDGEEYGKDENLVQIPNGISLGVIGIGTSRGGKIPIRTKDGSFRGYKRDGNQEVESKLNEEYFRSIRDRNPNSQYWIANSYSLPTEEIVAFFERSFNDAIAKADISHRPVYGYPLIGLSILLLIFASVLSTRIKFKPQLFVYLIAVSSLLVIPKFTYAEAELSPRGEELIEQMASGSSGDKERLELAQEFLNVGRFDSAKKLYEEVLSSRAILAMEEMLNLGTAQLFSGEISNGLATYEKLKKQENGVKSEMIEMMRNNVLAALKKNEQEKQQEQEKNEELSENDENDEEDNEKESSDENSGDPSDQVSDTQEEQEELNQGDEQEDNEDLDSDTENSNEKEQEKDSDEDESQDANVNEAQSNEIPALIQQIMNDDRELQQEQLDMSTREPRRTRGSKDW